MKDPEKREQNLKKVMSIEKGKSKMSFVESSEDDEDGNRRSDLYPETLW